MPMTPSSPSSGQSEDSTAKFKRLRRREASTSTRTSIGEIRGLAMRKRPHVLLFDADGTWVRLSIIDADSALITHGTASPSSLLSVTVRKAWKGTWEQAAQRITEDGVTRLSPHDLSNSICEALGIHEGARPSGAKAKLTVLEGTKEEKRLAG